MSLPIRPPVSPMLAQLVRELPVGPDLQYEPKWDGFRTIVFRDGAELSLISRNERDMTRYFPELRAALLKLLPRRIVLDGEIVIVTKKGLDFDALLLRVHPAASRIERLAKETPTSFIAFDILALGSADLRPQPLRERRRKLEAALAAAKPPLHVTPATTDPAAARDWFKHFEGAGIDGVVAKSLALEYVEGRRVMFKLKHERTADCVVAGYREHANGGVGSLLLGLYDAKKRLQHVGIAAGFSASRRRELARELAPLRRNAEKNHPWLGELPAEGLTDARRPGGSSRWSRGRDLAWLALRPERVAEVRYDHLQGDRFRHATQFVRWRPDRAASSCTYAQLEAVHAGELSRLLGGDAPARAAKRAPPAKKQTARRARS